jgi:hypothetical protein
MIGPRKKYTMDLLRSLSHDPEVIHSKRKECISFVHKKDAFTKKKANDFSRGAKFCSFDTKYCQERKIHKC